MSRPTATDIPYYMKQDDEIVRLKMAEVSARVPAAGALILQALALAAETTDLELSNSHGDITLVVKDDGAKGEKWLADAQAEWDQKNETIAALLLEEADGEPSVIKIESYQVRGLITFIEKEHPDAAIPQRLLEARRKAADAAIV